MNRTNLFIFLNFEWLIDFIQGLYSRVRVILPFQTRKRCQNYLYLSQLPRPPIFFSNRKVSKLPKPSLSITYHQSFNKSNLLVKNIGFRRNLTFCCISVQIFNSLNRLKLIFVGFTRKSVKSGQYYWNLSRIL